VRDFDKRRRRVAASVLVILTDTEVQNQISDRSSVFDRSCHTESLLRRVDRRLSRMWYYCGRAVEQMWTSQGGLKRKRRASIQLVYRTILYYYMNLFSGVKHQLFFFSLLKIKSRQPQVCAQQSCRKTRSSTLS
jgi:hypothetical protein